MKPLTRLIIASSIGRPFLVFGLVLALALFSVAGIFRISFDDGMRTLFTSDSPAYHRYVTHAQSFAQSETDVVVLVSSSEPLDVADLGHLQDFVLDAQFLNGIDGVFSVFSLQKRAPDGTGFVPLLPDDLENQAEVAQALQDATAQTDAGIALVSSDLHQTTLIFSIGSRMSEISNTSHTLHQLEALTKETAQASGLKFGITGLLPLRESIIKGLKSDQTQINILGALLGLIVSIIMFRSLSVAVLNTVTPVAALVFCLGSFGWLGLPINALTNALPVLILVLASSDSIHLTFEIRRRMGAGEPRLDAIRNAVIDIAPPCVLTSLTTVLAFASLFYSGSPIVRDLALAGVSGVMIALVTVLFVHPMVFVLASALPFVEKALPVKEAPTRLRPRIAAIGWIIRRRRAVTLAGTGLCVVSLWLLLPIETRYRILENVDEKREVVQVLKQVENISGPINTINIPLGVRDGLALSDAAVFADLGRIHASVQGMADVRAVISLLNLQEFLKGDQGVMTPAIFRDRLDQLPERFQRRMVAADGRSLQVALLVPDLGSQRVKVLADAVDRRIANLDLQVLDAGAATGFLVMSSSLSDDLIRQLTISFLIAALACPALIGVWYRRLDFGLAAIIPNILPIAFAGAVLTLFDFDIQMTSALALTIAFGIALDDSIHVFNRLSLTKGRQRLFSARDVLGGMARVAPALVATTVILAAGLLATQISDMPMIRFFGLLCIATFVLALLSDLILLPALLVWLDQRKGIKWAR